MENFTMNGISLTDNHYYSNLVIMDDIVSASSELIHLSYGFMIYRMIFLYTNQEACVCVEWMCVHLH